MLFIVKSHPKDYLLQRCQGPLQWINLMDTTVIKLSKLPKIWTVIGYHKPLDVKLGGHIIIHGVFLESNVYRNLIIMTKSDKSKLRDMLRNSWPEIMKNILKDKNHREIALD